MAQNPGESPRILERSEWPAKLAGYAPEIREAVRQSLLVQLHDGDAPRKSVTLARTRELARCDQRKVAALVKAWRRGETPGLAWPWDEAESRESAAASGGPADESDLGEARARLAELVRSARSHDDRDEVLREIGACLLAGAISDKESHQARSLLGELRLSGKDAREVPPEDPERIYLVSQDGALLLEAFERVVSEERRERVLAFAREVLEEDVEELPAVDPVGSL